VYWEALINRHERKRPSARLRYQEIHHQRPFRLAQDYTGEAMDEG
jgi:hypothetical protein